MRVAAFAFMTLSLGMLAVAHAQNRDVTPSSVEPPNTAAGGQKASPGTVGAMQNSVSGKATSAEDAKRQSQGRPTAAQEALGQQKPAKQPDPTQYAPGTVGASPGADTPSQVPRK